MPKVTKKGALEVTQTLDRVANLFQSAFETLGVPQKYAHDFALRCDMMADHVERYAGIKGAKEAAASNGGWDPAQIGEEKSGPLRSDADESSYMGPNFTQQENSELREDQESGALQKHEVIPDQQKPEPGQHAKQASELRKQLQAATIAGKSPKLLKALALAAKVAEEEEIEEEEKAEGKKADLPPEFLEQQKSKKDDKKDDGKKAEDVDDDASEPKDDGKKAEEAEDEEEEQDEGKKASHGFNLFA